MTNIYKKVARLATEKFLENGLIDSNKREVYAYGFEILLSTITYLLVFLVVSIVTRTVIPSLAFMVGFYIIRTIAGGYHANTYISCHLLFLANHLVAIFLLILIPDVYKQLLSSGLMIIAVAFLLIFAPVAHPNKPFTKNEKVYFRRISCIYSFLLLLVALVSLLLKQTMSNCLFGFSIGSLSATISLLFAKIIYT